jgi:hypothetical protein
MMASQFIGVIRSASSGQVLAVVNPDEDAELNNPRLLLIRQAATDAIELIRVPRDDYMATLTLDDLAELVARVTGPR